MMRIKNYHSKNKDYIINKINKRIENADIDDLNILQSELDSIINMLNKEYENITTFNIYHYLLIFTPFFVGFNTIFIYKLIRLMLLDYNYVSSELIKTKYKISDRILEIKNSNIKPTTRIHTTYEFIPNIRYNEIL